MTLSVSAMINNHTPAPHCYHDSNSGTMALATAWYRVCSLLRACASSGSHSLQNTEMGAVPYDANADIPRDGLEGVDALGGWRTGKRAMSEKSKRHNARQVPNAMSKYARSTSSKVLPCCAGLSWPPPLLHPDVHMASFNMVE